MKRCPRCNQTYAERDLNYCLNDGEPLISFDDGPPPTMFGDPSGNFVDDAPTVVLDPPRDTQPGAWSTAGPVARRPDRAPGVATQYGQLATPRSQDTVLPTISLILGVFSMITICCWGGIPLGAAAMITGFLGIKNADKDPTRFGGRGMAIGGIVLGIVSFVAAFLFLLFSLLAS